ncbi:MAG: ATP-binding protein [Rhodothermales bacterium]
MDPLLLVFRIAVLGLAGYLWWSSRRLAKANAELRAEAEAHAEALRERDAALESAREDLRIKQDQLVRARQLASLGQLTGGIAHEIKNPLNFVNNFARLSVDLAGELKETLEEHRDAPVSEVLDEVNDLLDDLAHNAQKISEHGERADTTVRNMLMHARTNASQRQPTDLNKLVADYANLAYHGMRAADPHFNVTIEYDLDPTVGEVEVVPQDLGRVCINLFNNAFYAVTEKADADEAFDPVVALRTVARDGEVVIRVEDNGTGIPAEVRAQVFEPFFTTKPPGTGTGLGLSLSYEIITKAHGGAMEVESREGQGTTFILTIPRARSEESRSGEERRDG